MKLSAIFTFSSVFLFSCTDSHFEYNPPEPDGFDNVDERLWSAFTSFEEEAAKRGVDVDLRNHNLTGSIAPIDEQGIAGTCSYGSHRPNDIVIDERFWNSASENLREEVIFHELGHCYLMRGHTESTLQNNICASIMRSGTGTCRSSYNSTTKAYYLNELFGID